MHMHFSSLPIGSDLLVSLEGYFDQRLLSYAKQKILLYQMWSNYNYGHINLRIFDASPIFLFNTTETKPDY